MVSTTIVGDLFVVHDPAGDLETVVGGQTTLDWVQIYALLRGSFGDQYDFLSCYLDVGSGVVNLGAASDTIWQDATGIGRWTFNFRPSWATTKLQHHSHFSFFNLNTLLHEIGHRWLAFVNYADMAGGTAQHLLHQDWVWTPGRENQHWGRWLDNQNSSMDYDQAEWIDNGDGTFNRIDRDPSDPAHEEWYGYSPLDQYLMGLRAASDVPNFKVVRNPSPALTESGPSGVPTGPYTPSPSAATITIANVQNTRSDEPAPFSGPRSPTHLNSQRVFHEAVVVVTKNTTASSTFITSSESWRRRAAWNFRRATGGRAMIDSSLLRATFGSLYIKDNAADTGSAASGSPFWLSPDLWVRNLDDGATSDVHQDTIRGQSNWIYARVRNKSAQPYENVTVNFYRANYLGTEFLYPVDWRPEDLLGSAAIPVVPAAAGGIDGSAIAQIEWTADKIPPALGWHPCLLSEVIPMEVAPSGLHHVFENRKLAQRNISIMNPPPPPPKPGEGGSAGAGGAYMFAVPFRIGHELRRAQAVELRLWSDGNRDDVQLFLDPAGLVAGLAEEAEVIEADIPIDPDAIPYIENGVQAIPAPRPGAQERSRWPASGDQPLVGLTVFVPKGTELGLLPDTDGDEASMLRLRFRDDARIQVGHRRKRTLEERYRLSGLQPVLLNGWPVLRVTGMEVARVMLRLEPGLTMTLRIVGIVPAKPGLRSNVLYHVAEAVGDRVLGGLSVQFHA